MTRARGRTVAAAACAGAFALLAWVSAAGPVRFMRDTPSAGGTVSTRDGDLPPGPGGTGAVAPPSPQGPFRWLGASWVAELLTLLLYAVAAIALVAFLHWAWRRRWHRPPPLQEADVEALPMVARALVADAPAQLAALEEGEPRNAIVACWLRLEETVRAAGVPRRPSETTAEFTTRVLGSLAVDAAMINGLAELYREARFSDHRLGEHARRGALAALRTLHDDLREHAGDRR